MPRIPFIDARFFDPAESHHGLEDRFQRHLQKLRDASADGTHDQAENGVSDPEGMFSGPPISAADRRKIGHRTKRPLQRRDAASGLGHMKADDRARLQTLRYGVELMRIPNEHRADELAAELHAGLPWLNGYTVLGIPITEATG